MGRSEKDNATEKRMNVIWSSLVLESSPRRSMAWPTVQGAGSVRRRRERMEEATRSPLRIEPSKCTSAGFGFRLNATHLVELKPLLKMVHDAQAICCSMTLEADCGGDDVRPAEKIVA